MIFIIMGMVIDISIGTIISLIRKCFELCSISISKAYKNTKELQESNKQDDKKVTVEDLYPKENPND